MPTQARGRRQGNKLILLASAGTANSFLPNEANRKETH
jgi:hypothetical protein